MQVRSLGQEDPQKKEMATHPVFLPGECSAKYAHNNMYFNSCLYINNIFSFRGLVTKSCLTLVTPWTVAHWASLSMGFSRQEYWRGLPFPSPGDLPNPGIEPTSPALQADSLLLIHHEALGVIYSFTNFSIMEQTRFQLPKFIFDKNCSDVKQHILVKQIQA